MPLASFQVLQHRAVDMFIHTELLRSAALGAAIRIDDLRQLDEIAPPGAAAGMRYAEGGMATVNW